MRFSLAAHGRVGSPARAAAAALLMLFLIAVAGCGARKTDQSPAAADSQHPSSPNDMVVANAPAPGTPGPGGTLSETETAIQGAQRMSASNAHVVTLTDHRCIRFEPQWTNVHVGQAVTWHSELRRPIRIYVSPGVFDKLSYLIRPGATVTTSPVRESGEFSFWTEPSACREAPRGVLMAGPGVNVRESYYASAPGVH
jgi:plastocyanin